VRPAAERSDVGGALAGGGGAGLEHPQLVRLATWARLERSPEGHLFAEADEAPKVRAIAEAQDAGHIDPTLPPADVLSMVISLAMTWSPASAAAGLTDASWSCGPASGTRPVRQVSAGQSAVRNRMISGNAAGSWMKNR
jgi:hypothetical protein